MPQLFALVLQGAHVLPGVAHLCLHKVKMCVRHYSITRDMAHLCETARLCLHRLGISVRHVEFVRDMTHLWEIYRIRSELLASVYTGLECV